MLLHLPRRCLELPCLLSRTHMPLVIAFARASLRRGSCLSGPESVVSWLSLKLRDFPSAEQARIRLGFAAGFFFFGIRVAQSLTPVSSFLCEALRLYLAALAVRFLL